MGGASERLCSAEASREGSLREKDTSGGDMDIVVNEDNVAPWCVPSSSRVMTIDTACTPNGLMNPMLVFTTGQPLQLTWGIDRITPRS